MAQIQPPPTFAPVVIQGADGKPLFNPIWLDWFLMIAGFVSSSGGSSGTAQHNSLGGLQGGSANQFYHLTLANYTAANALAAVVTNGVLCRIAANSYTARTITGTANAVAVANGDGVAGNPTISLVQTTGWSAQTATPSKANLGAAPTVGAIASWCAAIQNMLNTMGITDA